MAFIYITGVPGSGKSTVCSHLVRKGYDARDIDSSDLGGPYNIASGRRVSMPKAADRTEVWFENHEWRVDIHAFEQLKLMSRENDIIICGVAEGDMVITGLFDKILYLQIDEAILAQRIAHRDENDYGKNGFELTDILRRKKELDARYSKQEAISIDADKSIDDTVRQIISLL